VVEARAYRQYRTCLSASPMMVPVCTAHTYIFFQFVPASIYCSSSSSVNINTTDNNGQINPVRRRSLGCVCCRQPIDEEGQWRRHLLQRYHPKGVSAPSQDVRTEKSLRLRGEQCQSSPSQHRGSNEPRPECDCMFRCEVELDATILPHRLPAMQRPHPFMEIDLAYGLRNFGARRQADLRPGSLQRNNPRVLRWHRGRTEGLLH
jgi:hypothetical protein